jgi:hypothetical protein
MRLTGRLTHPYLAGVLLLKGVDAMRGYGIRKNADPSFKKANLIGGTLFIAGLVAVSIEGAPPAVGIILLFAWFPIAMLATSDTFYKHQRKHQQKVWAKERRQRKGDS